MGYRRITRGRKAPGSKGKGKGTSKFKTRYRKMRGGVQGQRQSFFMFEEKESATRSQCKVVPNIGSEFSEGYIMNTHEQSIQAGKNTKSIVFDPTFDSQNGSFFGSKKGLRAGYIGQEMALIGNYQGDFLNGIGVIKNVNEPIKACVKTNPGACTGAFITHESLISGVNTKSVFLGIIKKGVIKDSSGLFFDIDDQGMGRLFIGTWYQNRFGGDVDKYGSVGIEVDFRVPNNSTRLGQNFDLKQFSQYEAVGIYFGYLRDGKRFGRGIYYDVKTGKETFVCYLGNTSNGDECVTTESFPEDRKKLFKSTVRADIGRTFPSLEKCRDSYKRILSQMVEDMGGAVLKADQAYNLYKKMCNDFVDFCFGLFDYVHGEYEKERKREETAAAAAKAEEEANQAAILRAEAQGLKVINPKDAEKEQQELAECVTKLKDKEYLVKTPQELQDEKTAAAAAAAAEYESLKGKDKKYNILEQKTKLLEELGENQLLPQHESRLRHSRSSDGDSPQGALLSAVAKSLSGRSRHRSLSRSQSPSLYRVLFPSATGTPEAQSPVMPRRSSISGSVGRNSAGGSKITRKNKRMRMSMRRVKSRRSRRGGSQCGMTR